MEKHLPGRRTAVYDYQHSYRVKVDPDGEGKGPGSGPSRVKTDSVYLGTQFEFMDSLLVGYLNAAWRRPYTKEALHTVKTEGR